MEFPQFRQYSDNNTLFKINSYDEFIEIKKVGAYFIKSKIKCTLYPEKLFVNDLLLANTDNIVSISEMEFNLIKSGWESNLKEFK